jgi:hypothetical protein
MREISLQEVVQVSGGHKSILDWSGFDAVQWGSAWLGAGQGYAVGVATSGWLMTKTGVAASATYGAGVGIASALALGAVGGAAGAAAGYFLGGLFASQVLERI